MARREFSRKVMAAAFARAEGYCEATLTDGERCPVKLMPGWFEYDHRIPDALGGEPTLENCVVTCRGCHKAKTFRADIPAVAKMKRQRDKHIGAMPRSRSSLRHPYLRKKMDGSVVARAAPGGDR